MRDTLKDLQDAFQRLKNGTPEQTPADGRISLKRINDEAGLSRGGIYYYKDFVKKTREELEQLKKLKSKEGDGQQTESDEVTPTESSQGSLSDVARLRQERNNEKRIKEDYRDKLDTEKFLGDKVLTENAILAHRVYELEGKLNKINNQTVIPINRGK